MASHSSTLAWKIPWMEEPGRLQSMGSLRVRHDWATSLSLSTFMRWRRKWQTTPVFLPGETQGLGKPGGLPSMGSHRVGHDWSDLAIAIAICGVLAPWLLGIKHVTLNTGRHSLNHWTTREVPWSLWFFILYWGIVDWRRKQQPTPVFLSGKSHGQRSLKGYSPWGHKELDTT